MTMTAEFEDAPLAFSISDAAKKLSIGRTTIYKMIDKGEIETFKIHGMRRISLDEIKRVMKPDGDSEAAPTPS